MKYFLIINGAVQGLLYTTGAGLFFSTNTLFQPVLYVLVTWQLLSAVINIRHEKQWPTNYVLHFFHWVFIGYSCLLLITMAGMNCDAFPGFCYAIIFFILLTGEVLSPLLITLIVVLNIRRIFVQEQLALK